mgnify:CR=1 FL=1
MIVIALVLASGGQPKWAALILLFVAIAFLASGALFVGASAAADCLPANECDAIKQQLREFRETAKPLRDEAREEILALLAEAARESATTSALYRLERALEPLLRARSSLSMRE